MERQVEQLELELENQQCAQATQLEELQRKLEPAKFAAVGKPVSVRYRIICCEKCKHILPLNKAAPACGAEVNQLGEDVSEVLEWVPASFKVIRHVRPKVARTKCDVIVQVETPSRPIARALLVLACWPMCLCRSTEAMFRCTGSQRFMHAKV